MLSIPQDWRCVCFNSDFTMVHTIHTSFTRRKHPGLDQFVPKKIDGGAWQISLTAAWNKQDPLKKRLQTWGSKQNIKKSKQQNTHIFKGASFTQNLTIFFHLKFHNIFSERAPFHPKKNRPLLRSLLCETDHHPIPGPANALPPELSTWVEAPSPSDASPPDRKKANRKIPWKSLENRWCP